MKRIHGFLASAIFIVATMTSREVMSTPLIMPFPIQSEVALEDGYGYTLKVCGEVLCKLEIKTPKGRIEVPRDELSTVVSPNILSAELYITPENGSYEMINFYITLYNFSQDERSKESVVFFQFRKLKLHSRELITRNAAD